MDGGERVYALTTRLKSSDGELVGGGAGGSEDQDFGLSGVVREKSGRALQEFGRGAGAEEGARGHSPIIARAPCALAGLGAGDSGCVEVILGRAGKAEGGCDCCAFFFAATVIAVVVGYALRFLAGCCVGWRSSMSRGWRHFSCSADRRASC